MRVKVEETGHHIERRDVDCEGVDRSDTVDVEIWRRRRPPENLEKEIIDRQRR